jgi:hypothetical protein
MKTSTPHQSLRAFVERLAVDAIQRRGFIRLSDGDAFEGLEPTVADLLLEMINVRASVFGGTAEA